MIFSILPEEVESGRGANPPLGLLYIAAAIRKFGRDEVEIIDAQAQDLDDAALERRIIAAKPHVVGVTALSFTMPDVMAVCAMAKKTGAMTVLGGPHAHIYPEETARLEKVDYVLGGEGEYSFSDLLDSIRENDTPGDVPGVAWTENGKTYRGPEPDCIDSLDDIPFPARDMLDVHRYTSVLARTSPITTMMSSRGCPFRCIFCDRPHLGRKFRARSAAGVVDEMEQCLRLGIREFLLYDDNFATDHKRAMMITEEILRRDLRVIFDVRLRVTDLDDELAVALRRAGCDRVHLGVESGDPDILEGLRKGITIDDAIRAFGCARRAGILTLAYFLIGSPGETPDTVGRTIDLARRLKPDYVHFSLLIPFPGTDLYKLGIERNMWDGDPWLEFARSPRAGFEPPVWEENFSRAELVKLTSEAYRTFYRDPAYLWRRLRRVRNVGEALRQMKTGLRILRI